MITSSTSISLVGTSTASIMSVSIVNNILTGPPIDLECPSNGIGWVIFNSCTENANKTCHISHVGPTIHDYRYETFASFKDRSTRVAQELLRRGIQPKDMVINCSPNNYDSGLTTAACFYIGAIPATLDPTLSDRECGHLLGLMQPKLIFAHKDGITLIDKAINLSGINTQVVVQGCENDTIIQDDQINFTEFLIREVKDFQPRKVDDLEATCIILFSSGSTGLSKGICVSHRALFLGTMTFMNILHDTEIMLHYSTLYWISGIMLYMGSFILGHCRIGGVGFTPENLCKLIQEHKICSIFLASPVAYQLETFPKLSQVYNLSTLKTIAISGGPVSGNQISKLRKWLQNINVFLCYGMTEVAGCVTGFIGDDKDTLLDYSSSCGRPLRGMQIKFVDPDTNQILPPGHQGELLFKPPAQMKLYYKIAEDSAKCFDSEGYYKSGDLGYYNEEGLIFVCDRIRDMFKYMSFHIVPAAVEAVLKQHPAVKECVVFGVPDQLAENLPAAAVVLQENVTVTKEEITNFVNDLVIDRERLRGGVFFMEEMPKTASGKIQRRIVRQKMLNAINNGKPSTNTITK